MAANEVGLSEVDDDVNHDALLLEDDKALEKLETDGDEVQVAGSNVLEESVTEDPELEAIKARVREMEEEAEKLKEMHSEVERQMNLSSPPSALNSTTKLPTWDEKMDSDTRSIWVGNVDYGTTAEELEQHFHGCGPINRVTILCDKFTGHPKGFAYIEFSDKDSVAAAQALDDSLFRARQIKVTPKRTNRPGITTSDRGGWKGGRGGSFRGRGRSGFHNAYNPRFMSRGRGSRGRRASWFSPY